MNTTSITEASLNEMSRFYRANLINCISGLKAVHLIGTVNEAQQTNLAIFSSIIHLGANPALLAFIQRPITDTSHTYKNILATKYYTINHINSTILNNAHYTSAKFAVGISEFEECKLTPDYKNNFIAPYVAESIIQIGMELVETIPITNNRTTMVIGKIIAIHIADNLLAADGNLDLEKSNSITVAGLETYYSSKKVQQYPYAKVEELPNFLPL